MLSSPTVAGNWFFRGRDGMSKELAARGVDFIAEIEDHISRLNADVID